METNFWYVAQTKSRQEERGLRQGDGVARNHGQGPELGFSA
jgi:hypothetical protein